nr:MAG TPA: hypothetical protein [Caudoviricetes sp.]
MQILKTDYTSLKHLHFMFFRSQLYKYFLLSIYQQLTHKKNK